MVMVLVVERSGKDAATTVKGILLSSSSVLLMVGSVSLAGLLSGSDPGTLLP